MTATDKLRSLLDERGVEYYKHEDGEPLRELHEGRDDATSWRVGGANVCAVPFDDYTFDLWIDHATPEQAIAATLGSETINKTGDFVTHDSRAAGGTLTAEQVRKAIFNGSSYASYDGAQYYANGIDMQAIADELNSRAERTCRIIGFDDGVDEGIDGEWHQYAEPQYDLSCGHSSQGAEPPSYCPNCGAKVVGE